jgi:cell division protein FtsQ
LSVALAEAAAIPRRVRMPELHLRPTLAGLAPTRRSLAIGCGILALAFGGYALARESSLFSISRVEVRGGSPRLAADVQRALAPVAGASLVGLDGRDVVRRVEALPTVARASYDRAFPHTLRITVVPERPAAVLRRGPNAWLVSVRGRVIERLAPHGDATLPRIWIAAQTPVLIGERLDPQGVGATARAVGLAGPFASRVASASYTNGSLVFHLRSGLQLLLGDRAQIRLKVAVAAHALALVPAGSSFLDVSVPGRVVSGLGSPDFEQPQSSSRG